MKEDNFMLENRVEDMLANGENIIWRDKPNKKAYVLGRSLILFPIALIWLLVDSAIIALIVNTGIIAENKFLLLFLIPFFALHLLPVWMFISSVIKSVAELKNVEYVITDRRLIVKKGLAAVNFEAYFFNEIVNVRVSVGLLDKKIGVGDLFFSTNGKEIGVTDIYEPYKVYNLSQKVIMEAKENESNNSSEIANDNGNDDFYSGSKF